MSYVLGPRELRGKVKVPCMHCRTRFNPRCDDCIAESKAELRRIEAEEAAEESRQQEEEE